MASKISDYDYHLSIGGRFKLLENYTVNLQFSGVMNLHEDMASALDLEFDPCD